MKPVQPKYSFVTRFRSAGFFVRCHMDGTTSATGGRARTYYEKQKSVREEPLTRRTALAHVYIHTYINVYTRARFSSITHYYYERAYSPRANTFFLLTATTAHTYMMHLRWLTVTRGWERERERDRTIGLDLLELRQSREHELLYRFATNLVCNTIFD